MEQATPQSMKMTKIQTIPTQTTMDNMVMFIGRTQHMYTITNTSQTPQTKRMEQNKPPQRELMEPKKPVEMKHQIAPMWIRWISLTSKTSQT